MSTIGQQVIIPDRLHSTYAKNPSALFYCQSCCTSRCSGYTVTLLPNCVVLSGSGPQYDFLEVQDNVHMTSVTSRLYLCPNLLHHPVPRWKVRAFHHRSIGVRDYPASCVSRPVPDFLQRPGPSHRLCCIAQYQTVFGCRDPRACTITPRST
ncbi:hypothetical protein BKA83DRAFT_1757088 [Pisolithus microcarpus]|nr:hypothetical protein BKA83DRAFT_1757088 [Pisolithus microcarpus]